MRNLTLFLLLAVAPVCAQPAKFDTASIKPSPAPTGARTPGSDAPYVQYVPGGVMFRGVTLRRVISEAYHLSQQQVSGGPGWLDSDRYDIQAQSGKPANMDEIRKMLQPLLAERCKLHTQQQSRELAVYALTVEKGQSKLSEGGIGQAMAVTRPKPGVKLIKTFEDRGTVQHFAEYLSNQPPIDRPVLDKTGLTGIYLFIVGLYSDEDVARAIESQTGLKLEPQKATLPVLVIDRIEKPTGN